MPTPKGYAEVQRSVVATYSLARHRCLGLLGLGNRLELVPVGQLAEKLFRFLCIEYIELAGLSLSHPLST